MSKDKADTTLVEFENPLDAEKAMNVCKEGDIMGNEFIEASWGIKGSRSGGARGKVRCPHVYPSGLKCNL